MNNKIIAPILISVIFSLYYIVYFVFLVSMLEGIMKYILGIIPITLCILMIHVCFERINEIKRGEEDDISQY